ncbi:hypothetical protein M440DRAFT_1402596 [Trichoderma longibrachiatum ATCC 18648]|uniref:Azaphilone pigments biosynthesis cluster protein L N-terminal domain-containing protein n=1 Tax=Trichoderma longibrachiatum ATCC 18648 TaxID=983965 RepID=A0A2T4C0M2_TRILO|nr:hypothetical protein M440DRAFT_1402596 [Trichoderma longibrachiatum ATCC 18648]
MADFAGVASSGVQACSAIATYVSSLKHRDEDLASINRQAQALESVFRTLGQSLAEESLDPLTSSAAAQVSASMKACEAELHSLQRLIARFSDNLPPNARSQDKILQQAVKLKYPLRKPDISRIQGSLGVIKENLTLALQNLKLRYSQLAISKLSNLEEASGQASASLDALMSSVSALEDIVSPLEEQVPTIQRSVDSLSQLVNAKADMQIARMQGLQRQSTQSNDALSQSVSGLHTKLDGLLERFAETAAIDEPDARMSMYRLVSKPSNLASLCGRFDSLSEGATLTSNALQRAPMAHESACPCRQRSVHRTKRLSWGSWGIWDKEVITFKHYKGCQYFRSEGDERNRLRGIKLAGSLKNAIIITFYTSTGAGGHSLGAKIEYCATVDRKTSPAFRVMHVLKECVYSLGYQDAQAMKLQLEWEAEHQPQWERLALVATQKLESLFELRKASAKDIDSRNQSLLHAAADVAHYVAFLRLHLEHYEEAYSSPVVQVAKFLIKRQVSASLHDLDGRQAFQCALGWIDDALSIPLAEAFYPANEDIHLSGTFSAEESFRAVLHTQILVRSVRCYATIPRVAEGRWQKTDLALGFPGLTGFQACYGPLSVAVLSNDQAGIYRMLRKHPDCLKERGLRCRRTPLHLAVSNPECLQILVERCNTSLLVQGDAFRFTVLGYAITLSETLCNQREDEDESSCRCTLSVRILLEAGCPIIPYRDFNRGSDGPFNSWASHHCRVYLAKSLLQRRQRLKSVAEHYLSPKEINSFNLHRPTVLDIYAMQVDELLRHRGCIEFGPLATYVADEITLNDERVTLPIYDHRSIYHELSAAEDAEIYYRLGFHEIPVALDKPRMRLRQSNLIGLPFVKWLLDHDASLWEWTTHWQFPKSDGLTNEFILAILCGKSLPFEGEGDEEVAQVLEERMLSCRLVDGCVCPCSLRGCTPFVERIKGLYPETVGVEIVAKFTAYLKEYGNALQREHYHAAIRFTTFEGLGIAHTCIDKLSWEKELGAEEISEIQEEYAELYEILESLVEEFEEHAFEAFDAATDGVGSMIAFWNGYWVDRMQQVLSELSRAGEESKPAAEDLGVVWVREPDKHSRPRWEGWDHYFRMIEEIE